MTSESTADATGPVAAERAPRRTRADRIGGDSAGGRSSPPTDKSGTVDQALAKLVPFERLHTIAEVGCGRGALARRLARRVGESGHVVAFDLDRDSVSRARAQSRAERIRNVQFDVGSATHLPLDDDSVDLAVCCSLLCSLPRPSEALREMTRIVRPGGFVAVAEPVSRQLAHDPDDKSFTELLEKLSRAFSRGWGGRRTDQAIGLKVPGLLLQEGLEPIAAEMATQVHLLGDVRRDIGEVVEQLSAECSNLPAETMELLVKGGMSRQEIREHRIRAEKRLIAFASDPAAVARSGYVRLMAPLLVTVGIKNESDSETSRRHPVPG